MKGVSEVTMRRPAEVMLATAQAAAGSGKPVTWFTCSVSATCDYVVVVQCQQQACKRRLGVVNVNLDGSGKKFF